MPELKKVEIETQDTPPPQATVPDSQLTMAVTYGQMTESNRQLIEKLDKAESERSVTTNLLTNLAADIQELKSRQDTTSRQTETLNQSLTDAMLTQETEDSNEEDNAVIPITPMTETKVTIDSKPVTAHRSFLHKLIFGNR